MEVNITKRIDTPDGRRFCKVIFTPNGRVKPDWVEVDDRQERHPEGVYYLDWTEDGQRKRMAVGSDATAAYNCLKKKQHESGHAGGSSQAGGLHARGGTQTTGFRAGPGDGR